MKRLYLDFETYWSDTYSVSKMAQIKYVLDPQFEAHGCAFIHDDGQPKAEWIDGPDLPAYFETIDWPNTFAVSHNALFDMMILSLRYNIIPGFYGDTLSMARNRLGPNLSSVSLENVSQYYGLKAKWKTAAKFKGLSLAAIKAQPWLYNEMKAYARDDANKCKIIFEKLMLENKFPPRELAVIDMVIRMATVPKFELDMNVLAAHLAEVRSTKDQLLADAKLTKDRLSEIMSDQQLASKLLFLGVLPPMKFSKKTGKEAYAFAKTDKEFTDLLEHDKPMVQALVAARLGHKSTLEETRTQRLLDIGACGTLMPVPLKYSGAHTHRFSGDWKINLQNLPKGGELRKSLRAPRGKKVIAVDASQIEARINAVLSNEAWLIEAFRQGRDVYSEFATDIYGRQIVKSKEFEIERNVGKVGILSLGYGASYLTYQAMVRNQAGIALDLRDASAVVDVYRNKCKAIVNNWNYATNIVLPTIAGIEDRSLELASTIPGIGDVWKAWGPIGLERQRLILPNDNEIRYRDLRRDLEGGSWKWSFMRGNMKQHIYGAKVVENVVQALAFLHIIEVALRVLKLTDNQLWPAHQVHDELIYVEDDDVAEQIMELVVQEMSKPPVWLPHAPLAAEGHIGQTYYEAK